MAVLPASLVVPGGFQVFVWLVMLAAGLGPVCAVVSRRLSAPYRRMALVALFALVASLSAVGISYAVPFGCGRCCDYLAWWLCAL